jgi:polyhydroxyalkanoate synthesis regulator phasin
MKKLVGSLAIIAALGAGAFAISTVLPAGAQSSPPSTSSSAPPAKSGGRGAAVKSALDGLVQNGTINQDQENAVIQALKGALASGNGHGRFRHCIVGGMLKVAADKIGVQPKDLIEARRNGQSIADVANEHHVNPGDVVSAIVNAVNQRIDQAVANGRLAQDKANELKAKVPQLADRFVNTKGGMGRSSGGPDAGSSSSTASSSSSS